jgi:hypothetical protein
VGEIDCKRRKIDIGIKKFIFDLLGAYIDHDCNIHIKQPSLFTHKGNHLTEAGNQGFSE